MIFGTQPFHHLTIGTTVLSLMLHHPRRTSGANIRHATASISFILEALCWQLTWFLQCGEDVSKFFAKMSKTGANGIDYSHFISVRASRRRPALTRELSKFFLNKPDLISRRTCLLFNALSERRLFWFYRRFLISFVHWRSRWWFSKKFKTRFK